MELNIIPNFAYFVKSLEFVICIKQVFNCMYLCLGLSILKKFVYSHGDIFYSFIFTALVPTCESCCFIRVTLPSLLEVVITYKDLNKEFLVRIHR